jgi:hypothetical protein
MADRVVSLKRYRNLSHGAGVRAYAHGPGWIHLQFVRGGTYEYTSRSVGQANLQKMKRLADAGEGLTTFINQHPDVKNGYARRLR